MRVYCIQAIRQALETKSKIIRETQTLDDRYRDRVSERDMSYLSLRTALYMYGALHFYLVLLIKLRIYVCLNNI